MKFCHLIWVLLIGFIVVDTAYAGYQYLHQPLDGDMGWNLVPAGEVLPVLSDPFGWQVLSEGLTYPNPNRFFSHWVFREYLLWMPGWLQAFAAPVDSVYLACGLAKLATHLALLWLLARAVTGPRWRSWRDVLLVGCLLAPFFQSGEFRGHIGIVDASTTYVFFYALPAVALLIFAMPFVDYFGHGERLKPGLWRLVFLAVLAVVVCLSGPLNPAVVLVATAVGGLCWLTGGIRLGEVPKRLHFLLALVNLLALYSLFLGRYNSLTIATQLPLTEIYALLPGGIWRQFTTKLAFPVLFGGVLVNALLIRQHAPKHKLLRACTWVVTGVVLYLLLLPLGGFWEYRAGVLRYDTILPVTLALIALYAATARWLLASLPTGRGLHAGMLVAIALLFTNADRLDRTHYDCERAALAEIAASPLTEVPLTSDCPVLTWRTYRDTYETILPGRLLHRWGLTEEVKSYYHPSVSDGR
jgi:hypothetical protein